MQAPVDQLYSQTLRDIEGGWRATFDPCMTAASVSWRVLACSQSL